MSKAKKTAKRRNAQAEWRAQAKVVDRIRSEKKAVCEAAEGVLRPQADADDLRYLNRIGDHHIPEWSLPPVWELTGPELMVAVRTVGEQINTKVDLGVAHPPHMAGMVAAACLALVEAMCKWGIERHRTRKEMLRSFRDQMRDMQDAAARTEVSRTLDRKGV